MRSFLPRGCPDLPGSTRQIIPGLLPMKFVLYSLAGTALGGVLGYVIPLTYVAVVDSGQAPLSFFWTSVTCAVLGLLGGLLYAGFRRKDR